MVILLADSIVKATFLLWTLVGVLYDHATVREKGKDDHRSVRG